MAVMVSESRLRLAAAGPGPEDPLLPASDIVAQAQFTLGAPGGSAAPAQVCIGQCGPRWMLLAHAYCILHTLALRKGFLQVTYSDVTSQR